MNIVDYIRIARPGYWFKNIFVLPGILLAVFFVGDRLPADYWVGAIIGLISVCLVASSNYVINEILDAPSDAHHPDKKLRPIPSGRVKLPLAYTEWLLLAAAGFTLAATVNTGLLLACVSLWIMGLIYNVPPVRAKDQPYLDVLCESVNNPIRMIIGWYSVGSDVMPTISVLLAYWMFGAFLMAIKRFAEYRHIGDEDTSGHYRNSFKFYNEERLLVSILFYAALFGMFSGVFIARYRVEMVLALPFVAFATASYFRMGFKPDSPTASPERIWRYPSIMVPATLAFVVCSILLFVDLADLSELFAPRFSPEAIK